MTWGLKLGVTYTRLCECPVFPILGRLSITLPLDASVQADLLLPLLLPLPALLLLPSDKQRHNPFLESESNKQKEVSLPVTLLSILLHPYLRFLPSLHANRLVEGPTRIKVRSFAAPRLHSVPCCLTYDPRPSPLALLPCVPILMHIIEWRCLERYHPYLDFIFSSPLL